MPATRLRVSRQSSAAKAQPELAKATSSQLEKSSSGQGPQALGLSGQESLNANITPLGIEPQP